MKISDLNLSTEEVVTAVSALMMLLFKKNIITEEEMMEAMATASMEFPDETNL